MAALRKRWEILPPAPPEYLAGFPDLPPLVAQLLHNRQILTSDEVEAFLRRDFAPDNPFLLQGMNEAVARLRQAIRVGEAIAVYGDYDADGVTATALLVLTLRTWGAKVEPYLPKRVEQGYGLHESALKELADRGTKVVVTVDCGVRSIDEADYAHELGMDLIITDHHTLSDELPRAIAVVDPRREDECYPFKNLAGVGLAFKLAQALLRADRQVPLPRSQELPQEDDLVDLVALGTIADLAPLLGENRALVCRGLEKINEARRPGIAAMLQEAALEPGCVDAGTVGYVLGPRLNAAGRLDDAMASYDLLTTASAEEASRLAQQLGAQNRERQRLMAEMVEQSRAEVRALAGERVYVLASASYLPGIAGLVAGRITEEFYRPTLVIALEDGKSRGSARSIEAFHITRALDECEGLLVRHGGHAAAAGFTIENDRIDEFRSRLKEIAARQLTEVDLVPRLKIDMALPLATASWDTVALLDTLQPFGVGNPRPTFASYNVQVRGCRVVGRERQGLKLALSDGVAVWDAIAFGQELQPESLPKFVDIAYTIQTKVWNGQKRLELVLKDLRPAALDRPSATVRNGLGG